MSRESQPQRVSARQLIGVWSRADALGLGFRQQGCVYDDSNGRLHFFTSNFQRVGHEQSRFFGSRRGFQTCDSRPREEMPFKNVFIGIDCQAKSLGKNSEI